MRAIGYFRAYDGLGSFQELGDAFYRYCDLNLHQPVEVFGERGPSEPGRRTELHRMVDFMRESKSSFLVVIPDARHLGSDLESVVRTVVQLEAGGAKLTCTDESYPDPLQNALQRVGIRGVSRTRSDRIRESMRARAIEGRALGRPPYGYRIGLDGTLEIVREEAGIVETIFRLHTREDQGLRLIAGHLNERGIATRRGGRWNMVTIRDILRNPVYMGTSSRFGLRVSKSHEAIIPASVFRTAQDKTRSRRPQGRVANAEPFVLSGLAYCGYCGNKMMGVTRRQSWRRKDGRRAQRTYRYYQCQSRNNQSICAYHTWRASLLEDTVLAKLSPKLRAKADKPGSSGQHTTEKAQRILNARADNAERRLVHAVRRAAEGALATAALGKYVDEIDRARRRSTAPDSSADVHKVIETWDSLSVDERQGFLIGHVTRIEVKDNSVNLVL